MRPQHLLKMPHIPVLQNFPRQMRRYIDYPEQNTLHSYLVPNVTHAIVELRKLTKTHNITFGVGIDLLIIISRVL